MCNDPVKIPPTRPVCAANSAYNSKLSHIMCNILRPIWQNNEYACENTEDLLAEITTLNNSDSLKDDIIIGSLDVKSLYPSLNIDATVDVMVE